MHRSSKLKKSNKMQQYADQIRTYNSYLVTFEEAASQIVWSVPEAATTALCTTDDGWDGLPKHVEYFSSK